METIKMKSWIECYSKEGQMDKIKVKNIEGEECYVMGILGVPSEQLSIIGNFYLEDKHNNTFCYTSNQLTINSKPYRIIYIPPNKNEPESVHHLTQLIRQLSDIVISDASSGLSHMRHKQQLQNTQFVVVNGSLLYQMGLGKQSIELVKQVKSPFFEHIDDIQIKEPNREAVEFSQLQNSVMKFSDEWILLRGKQQSWNQINSSTLNFYKAQKWLNFHSEKFGYLKNEDSMLSTVEVQLIQEQIKGVLSTTNTIITKQIVTKLMREINQMNSSKTLKFVSKLQSQLLNKQIQSFEQLKGYKNQMIDTLTLYNIDQQYLDYALFPTEKEILKKIINKLSDQKSKLQEKIINYEHKICQKNHHISEYKNQLQLYSSKVADLFNLQHSLQCKDKQLQNLTTLHHNLQTELSSSLLTQNNLQSENTQLLTKVEHLSKENKDLLECLQEFTKQHITLHNQIQSMKTEVIELKGQICESNQIELRALRSIENQAQVKNRLTRYEVYVKELKLAVQSFKKLEGQKINYILQQNYAQYQALKEEYTHLQAQLQKEIAKNRDLSTAVQHEKIRMSYYERFITNNYPNEPIPECSEETSKCNSQREHLKIEDENLQVL